mmetsp:Transcript_12231/g.22626  ORF Transcript_12231/g.22626 Transcript_12231/m.22626 type:complete len:227 (+) Transcript_12231:267-947(+)
MVLRQRAAAPCVGTGVAAVLPTAKLADPEDATRGGGCDAQPSGAGTGETTDAPPANPRVPLDTPFGEPLEITPRLLVRVLVGARWYCAMHCGGAVTVLDKTSLVGDALASAPFAAGPQAVFGTTGVRDLADNLETCVLGDCLSAGLGGGGGPSLRRDVRFRSDKGTGDGCGDPARCTPAWEGCCCHCLALPPHHTGAVAEEARLGDCASLPRPLRWADSAVRGSWC